MKQLLFLFTIFLVLPKYLFAHTPFEDLTYAGQVYFNLYIGMIILGLIYPSIDNIKKNNFRITTILSIIIILLSILAFSIIPLILIILWGRMLFDNIDTFFEYYYPTTIFCSISLIYGILIYSVNRHRFIKYKNANSAQQSPEE
jgi:hypothetical protein